MTRNRLEAFSDAVIAIAITIMVLELHPPVEPTLEALRELAPVFVAYVLSFVMLGIYWNNHHHLMQATRVVDGRVLWANMHLLFWLSLFPFGTAWIGQTTFGTAPVAVYGVILLMAAIAYGILVRALLSARGQSEALRLAVGSDRKGNLSIVAYVVSVPLAFLAPLPAFAIFIGVAAVWFVPDRRMERAVGHPPAE